MTKLNSINNFWCCFFYRYKKKFERAQTVKHKLSIGKVFLDYFI